VERAGKSQQRVTLDPMTGQPIDVDHRAVASFCRRHLIQSLAFFGSVLRDDFSSESDVDVLVEFEPGARVGLIRLAQIEAELAELLGREVDLRTPADLSPYFRDQVLADARVQYAQG
jgi:uncharacterized protein